MCVVCARSHRQRKYGSFIEYLREKDPRIREKVMLRNDPVFFFSSFLMKPVICQDRLGTSFNNTQQHKQHSRVGARIRRTECAAVHDRRRLQAIDRGAERNCAVWLRQFLLCLSKQIVCQDRLGTSVRQTQQNRCVYAGCAAAGLQPVCPNRQGG